MSKDVLGNCWQCGAELRSSDLGRETNCIACGKPTRVCRNCRWYDPSCADQCREPVAEPVSDKIRANYCEYFEPTGQHRDGGAFSDQEALRKAAEDLFKS